MRTGMRYKMKKLIGLLLVCCMLVRMIPTSTLAVGSESEKSEQVTEAEQDTTAEEEGVTKSGEETTEAETITETDTVTEESVVVPKTNEEATEAETVAETGDKAEEATTYDNSIYAGDGTHRAEEQPLTNYPVSLYKADDTLNAGMRMAPRKMAFATCTVTGTISGSYSSLAAAIAAINANPGTTTCTITMSENETLSATQTINAGKSIILTSSGSTAYTIMRTVVNSRHLDVIGSLTLENITLDGAGTGGGLQVDGNLIMEAGATIQNCKSTGVNRAGGGIHCIYGNITMNGGTISNNSTDRFGGGVSLYNSIMTMNGGTINNNISNDSGYAGGGVATMGNSSVFTMNGGTISNNAAPKGWGGGVITYFTFTMNGGIISDNQSTYGGGIYIYATSSNNPITNITGSVSPCNIINNMATNGSGGGIYMNDDTAYSYSNLTVAQSTVFSGNVATTHYEPPVDALTKYPQIQSVSSSISSYTSPLNNYDIYSREYHKVTVKYIDCTGNAIGTPIEDDYYVVSSFRLASTDIPGITDYIFVGWKNGVAGTPMRNKNVILSNITGAVTLYLIYGQDKGNDGIEDVTVTKKWKAADGTTLRTQAEVYPNINTTFKDAAGATFTNYTYAGYKIDGGALRLGTPSEAVTSANGDFTVIYVYNPDSYTINVAYKDRQGAMLTTAITPSAAYGSRFTAINPGFTDYVLVDWSLDGGTTLQGNTSPSIIVPAAASTITLIYGFDRGSTGQVKGSGTPDGTEDILITKAYKSSRGTTIGTSENVIVNHGSTFADAAPGITGYTYSSHSIDGDTSLSGIPSITPTVGGNDKTVTYVYTANSYTVNVNYEMRDTNSVPGATNFIVTPVFANTYAPTAAQLTVTGYKLVDWKLNGTAQGNTSPSITVPAATSTITLVYGYDRGTTGETQGSGTSDGVEDILVTKEFHNTSGTALQPDDTFILNIGDSFIDTHAVIAGYNYDGYKIDGGTIHIAPAEPSIPVSSGNADATVTYLYSANSYNIDVKYELRDGSSVIGATDFTAIRTYGMTYAPTSAQLGVTGYLLTDWKLNGILQGSASPSVTVPAANATITLVYGYDRGVTGQSGGSGTSDSTEDVLITKEYKTAGGTTLQPSTALIVNVGDSFTDIHTAITGYRYDGYKTGLGSLSTVSGEPDLAITGGMADGTVTYIYSTVSYRIDMNYETRLGGSITGKTDFTTKEAFGSTYTPTAAQTAVTGYILVDWKLDGVLQGNTAPSVTMPAANTTITLVYGYDSGGSGAGGSTAPDGIEDVTVTKKFLQADGTSLKPDETLYVNVGSTFSDMHAIIDGYEYAGYQIDGGTLMAAPEEPNILIGAMALWAITLTVYQDISVSYVYKTAQYNVAVEAVDTDGSSIDSGIHGWTATKGYQENFTASAPTIKGYVYQYWNLNGIKQSGDVKIASVEADGTIQLVYQKQAVTPTPDPTPDEGNYEFIKKPNVKNVNAGDTVTYIFTGFGNNWSFELEKYGISDIPDKGLDFVSANLPVFTNGSGVTYNIVYRTSKTGATTLYADIPADQPFSFKAPSIASGEYITSIRIQFDTVPSGFAVGDSITMIFKVWDNPPSETLTNIGMLSYKAGDEYKEFITGGASGGTITLSGYFGTSKTNSSNPPKTGDYADMNRMLTMLLCSLCGTMLLLSIEKKRRKKNN